MPSLWKKKGNRISRLVADLQTSSKRGGSLVVETGFPTSLIDLFVKNRDKLKKPKSKKHKSRKKLTVTEDYVVVCDEYDYGYDEDEDDSNKSAKMPSVSNSTESVSDLDVPISSVVGNCQKNDSVVEHDDKHETPVVELNHDYCDNDNDIGEKKRGNLKVSNEKSLVLFSILMGLLVLIVVLYTKRWFLAFITLGFLLLMLLEYVGNPVFKLFKPCENVVSMSVLKGGLAVVVALYTKWFVVGITMGASLLLLLEYAGNSGFGLFKPCRGATWTLQGFWSLWGAIKQNRKDCERDERRKRGVLTRSSCIGSKKRYLRKGKINVDLNEDFGEGVGDGVALRKEIEPEVGGNDLPLKKEIDKPSLEDGDLVASKGGVQPSSRCSSYVNVSSLLEEDVRNRPMYEHLAMELNCSINARSPCIKDVAGYIDLQGGKGAIEGREKGSDESKVINHNGKCKKGKKFWKKLVPKKKNKKNKHRHGRGCDAANTDCIQDAEAELEVDDEPKEGESDGEGSSILSYEQDEVGSEDTGASDSSCSVMLDTGNITTNPCGTIKERDGNAKYLTLMMIPLTGLIGGRMFAVVLTVICSLVFKMVRG